MLKTQSGKRQREKLKSARMSARSTAGAAGGSVREMVEQPAHDFRLKGAVGAGSLLETVFHVREAAYEVEKRIVDSRRPIRRTSTSTASDSYYREQIPIPTRAEWSVKQRAEDVAKLEDEHFEAYLDRIYAAYPPTRLNHFEHNLHVWKQLWKVVDLADILVLCADARHPLFHVPPSLYDYIVHHARKPMICVLNKIDFISARSLQLWLDDFKTRFPLLTVVPFSSFPHDWHSVTNPTADEVQERKRKAVQHEKNKAGKKDAPPPYGVENLMRVLEEVWKAKVEREAKLAAESAAAEAKARELDPNWRPARIKNKKAAFAKAREEREERAKDVVKNVDIMSQLQSIQLDHSLQVRPNAAAAAGAKQTPQEPTSTAKDAEQDASSSPAASSLEAVEEQHEAQEAEDESEGEEEEEDQADGSASSPTPAAASTKIIVGMIGHPNAGKSSLINALFGRPVVTVSETPGKTKHLQTLSLNPRIELCDCPGLVFPAVDMPRALQVLCGIFPISQLREPYSAVEYLAQRVQLEKIYGLTPPIEDGTSAGSGVAAAGSKAKTVAKKKPARGEDEEDEESDVFSQLAAAEAEAKAAAYEWSAWDICEAYARQRNYSIKGSKGLYDTQRAANDILHDALSGVVLLSFTPPGTDAADPQQQQTGPASAPQPASAAPAN